MHVRREARLVDDHRYGVELSLAPTPVKSSQKNRPDAPYEGLPPNRWMPGTNAKCPRNIAAGWWGQSDTSRSFEVLPVSGCPEDLRGFKRQWTLLPRRQVVCGVDTDGLGGEGWAEEVALSEITAERMEHL